LATKTSVDNDRFAFKV